MESFANDLRHSLRRLRKAPGFTAIAIATLALGIGVNTSMFSVVNATLFGVLPYPRAETLVRVFRTSPQSQGWPHSAANFLDHQAQNTVFESMAAFTGWTFNLAEAGRPAERLQGMRASAEFFPTLGVPPALGRGFTKDEDRPGADDVVVLSHGFWLGRFGGDPGVVGRTLRLDGKPNTIVGVMPAEFEQPLLWRRVDVWKPLALTDEQRNSRGSNWLGSLGRLKPGIGVREAQAEMSLLVNRLNAAYPATNTTDGLRLARLSASGMNETGRRVTWMTFGLASFVLLITCANIANLQLARVARRAREFAIQAALGAGRARIVRGALTESLVLGVLGGMAGLLLAWWGADLLGRGIVVGNRSGVEIPLDWRVFSYALILSIAAGLLSGAAPAWMSSRGDVGNALKQDLRGGAMGRGQHRISNTMIAGELAMALVLLAGSGLFVRGLRDFTGRDPGWRPDGLLTASVALPSRSYADDEQRRAFHERLEERVRQLPGVETFALADSLPIWSYNSSTNVVPEGEPLPQPGQAPLAYFSTVTPDYFATLGIPVKQGAIFDASIRADATRVVVVNEAMARRFWPGRNPIGQRIGDPDPEDHGWREVVAVVGDVRYPANLGEPDTPLQMYVPLAQQPAGFINIALRTSVSSASFASALRTTISGLDPDLPVFAIASARERAQEEMANFAMAGHLLTAFAVLGILLAALGIYGVTATFVAQRTTEFGIRLAIGAQMADIARLVLTRGVRLGLWGTAVGLVGAAVLARLLASAVPSLGAGRPSIIVAVWGLLMGVVLLACWAPALRASRVDPAVAVRYE